MAGDGLTAASGGFEKMAERNLAVRRTTFVILTSAAGDLLDVWVRRGAAVLLDPFVARIRRARVRNERVKFEMKDDDRFVLHGAGAEVVRAAGVRTDGSNVGSQTAVLV